MTGGLSVLKGERTGPKAAGSHAHYPASGQRVPPGARAPLKSGELGIEKGAGCGKENENLLSGPVGVSYKSPKLTFNTHKILSCHPLFIALVLAEPFTYHEGPVSDLCNCFTITGGKVCFKLQDES